MDVTSLLNANPLAVEQQKGEEKDGEEKKVEVTTKAPSRNRTPWDAGGYSLPINTISNPSTPPQADETHRRDSQSTPTSPRHKFSDSRSSLSSFTSSSQSASHSRFSSLSTVGSTYPSSNLAEAFSSALGQKPQALDFGPPSRMDGTLTYPQPGGSISPTGSLDVLALAAENEMTGQQAQQNADVSKVSSGKEKESGRCSEGLEDRPCSPSDAILIKRTTVPSLRLSTGEQDLNGASQFQPNKYFLSAPLESHHQSLIHSRSHKRALSAPDFPATVSGFMMSDTSSIGPQAEPTPPSSHHPDRTSPTNIPTYNSPDTPPPNTHGEIPATQSILCMYIPNCDTGSQLRKAISHIFGRNKMCTRLIPAEVWVHYCRKHYQRSRYRNPKEYAKLQCDLVQQQIRRVHEWSVGNVNRGLPGEVKDWGLSVRKREQKRLDELNGKKRNAVTAFEGDSDDDEAGSRANGILPATAVPEWLLGMCGKGYSTHKILEIFNRLHTEILADTMPCFPDIEILPNIAVDNEEPKSPKGYTKRGGIGQHKRSQSLGVAAMKSGPYSQSRRLSQPAIWAQGSFSPPVPKKRRPNGINEINTSDPSFSPYQRSRPVERPLQAGGRITQLSHRPIFPDINENGDEERFGYTNRYSHVPLPAPTPQRSGGQSMAAHLEMSNAHGARRSVHQRSQSDMSAFAHVGRVYTPSSSVSSAYTPESNHYGRNDYGQGHTARRAEMRPDSRFSEMQPQQYSHGPAHGRHQSMSMVPSSTMYSTQPSSTYYPPVQVTQYHSVPAPLPRTRITEDQHAQALFSSRR